MGQNRVYLPFLFFAALLAGACGGDEPPAREIVRPVRAISVLDFEEIRRGPIPGQAMAHQEVNLAFRVSGPLVEFPVLIGDEVTAGMTLAQIDPRDFEVALRKAEGDLAEAEAQLTAMKVGARPEDIEKLKAEVVQAEAEATRAVSEYDRYVEAVKTDAVSKSDVARKLQVKIRSEALLRSARESLKIGQLGARVEDIAAQEARVRALEATRDSAQDQLSYATLKAPFDGRVSATYVENFETVQAQQAIVRILDTSKIEMLVDLPESLISIAPLVQALEVEFDAFPGVKVPARIREIGTEANATTRTYPITLIMEQPEGMEILTGMAGMARPVKIASSTPQDGVPIPMTSLLEVDGVSYVWVIDESKGTASRQEVKVLTFSKTGVYVTGIGKGTVIATAGAHRLSEGQKVRVLAEEDRP